jgi:5-methylcytosine-specific restriction endonuclease McrA
VAGTGAAGGGGLMTTPRVPTPEIVQAYQETGSVWEAGKRVGLAGQTVHERLKSIGYPLRGRKWTAEEAAELRELAMAGVPLGEVARRLGRPYGTCATKASEARISFRRPRERKVPRGAGFDKASMTKHMRALEAYAGSVTQYARANGLHVDPFVKACQRHFPERWGAYVAERSDIPSRACEYCEGEFVPASGKQRFCGRRCGDDARRDAQYFGGKRKEAVGLAEGVCQLCGARKERGLSVHHVLGKENDPDNEALIALCAGCHQLVGHLGGRKFVTDPAALEALISLAWLRREGSKQPAGHALNVYVELTVGPEEEV